MLVNTSVNMSVNTIQHSVEYTHRATLPPRRMAAEVFCAACTASFHSTLCPLATRAMATATSARTIGAASYTTCADIVSFVHEAV